MVADMPGAGGSAEVWNCRPCLTAKKIPQHCKPTRPETKYFTSLSWERRVEDCNFLLLCPLKPSRLARKAYKQELIWFNQTEVVD